MLLINVDIELKVFPPVQASFELPFLVIETTPLNVDDWILLIRCASTVKFPPIVEFGPICK